MKIRHFIMAVGMVLTSFLPCSATDIFFQTIDAKDGLADNFVRDITRDTYGYIWLSTINGISRYDGYRLTNYMPLQYRRLSTCRFWQEFRCGQKPARTSIQATSKTLKFQSLTKPRKKSRRYCSRANESISKTKRSRENSNGCERGTFRA